MPVFVHDETDVRTFRMITSQFYVNGNAKQADIVRAFGVTAISVKRSVAVYRQAGPSGFYRARKTRGGAVLTATVLAEAQALLSAGQSIKEVAKTLQVKANTMHKAVQDGRLTAPERRDQKKAPSMAEATERGA
jgi:transposase-like protein